MIGSHNTNVFGFTRPSAALAVGKQLPANADVRLTVRVDIEDRNFHWETKRNGGAEYHFNSNVRTLTNEAVPVPNPADGPVEKPRLAEEFDESRPLTKTGFAFTPASDRQLRIWSEKGVYHPQPEWCDNIPHPIEQSR